VSSKAQTSKTYFLEESFECAKHVDGVVCGVWIVVVVKTDDVQGMDEVAHNLGKHSTLSDVPLGAVNIYLLFPSPIRTRIKSY
jgi:hypothetical protein